MARELLTFSCAGETLAASFDPGDGRVGLLIVTGGREIRSGAHGGLGRLAAAVAAAGFPVLRFERRGVGDSGGADPGFAESGPDIAAASAALRARCPTLRYMAGFGLCDGATALALHHRAARLDALLLANPWIVEPGEGLPPPAAIRRRYAERLRDPAAWRRLLGGAIDFRQARRGLRAAVRPQRDTPLAERLRAGLDGARAIALLAERDATATAFAEAHRRRPFALTVRTVASAAHSFAAAGDAEWLASQVIAALRELALGVGPGADLLA